MFNCYDTILQQQQREAIKSDKKMYLRGGSEAPAPNLAWRLRQERPGSSVDSQQLRLYYSQIFGKYYPAP